MIDKPEDLDKLLLAAADDRREIPSAEAYMLCEIAKILNEIMTIMLSTRESIKGIEEALDWKNEREDNPYR